MKVWLISLGLPLLSTILAWDGLDSSIHKLTGKWYTSSITTDCDDILDFRDYFKMMAANVNPVNERLLEISIKLPLPGGCQEFSVNCRKKESGQYFLESGLGDYTVEDYDTDCRSWFAVRAKHQTKNETCDMIMLYTRARVITLKEKESFKKFCLHYGFKEDDIIFMPPQVACAES